jgi:hypothetical protein
MRDDSIYRAVCSRNPDHARQLSPSELEALIVEGEHLCEGQGCDGQLELDDELELQCHVCHMVFPVTTLEDAHSEIGWGCEPCRSLREFDGDSIHVPGSFQARFDAYRWHQEDQDPKPIVVDGRTDYWEGLIHFCELHEFIGIVRDERIRAAPTGLFKRPAVCLSEATMGNWESLQGKHGKFGFVFRKRTILDVGGAPVIYLPPHLIRAQTANGGFAPEVQPFVQLLRTRRMNPTRPPFDFLHEREWRVPGDIDLTADNKPFAVIIDWDQVHWGVDDWQAVFQAASNFQELKPAEVAAPQRTIGT